MISTNGQFHVFSTPLKGPPQRSSSADHAGRELDVKPRAGLQVLVRDEVAGRQSPIQSVLPPRHQAKLSVLRHWPRLRSNPAQDA